MSTDQIIVKPDPEVTEDDVWTILSVADTWFLKGTALYHEATRTQSSLDIHPQRYSRIIGKPTAGLPGYETEIRTHREGIAAMLFAFAVENWLKGIAVMKRFPDLAVIEEPLNRALRTACEKMSKRNPGKVFKFALAFLESKEG